MNSIPKKANALLQKNFEKAVLLLGETIGDMDNEIEFKDKTDKFLTDKIGKSHEETKKQVEIVSLTEVSERASRVIRKG